MKISLISILLLTLLLSCGASKEEEIDNAIDYAQQLLTDKQCDLAIKELNDVGYQNSNARYLQTYASAYACKAGFSEITFFANDLSKLASGNTTFLPSLTKFSTSSTTSSTADSYTNMFSAINTLLYAGGITASSHANRHAVFGTSDTSNIELQALYLLLGQLGKYLYLHGNTDSLGKKGTRDTPETNDCLTDYTTAAAQAAVTAAGATISPCSNADYNDGHSELKNGAANRKKYLCQGTILFNNMLHIIQNLTLGTTSNTGTLGELDDNISALCTAGGLGAVCTEKDQTSCEANISIQDLELYFIAVFETMLTDA